MKVAINTEVLSSKSNYRGIGMYTKRLLEELKKTGTVEVLEFNDGKIPDQADLIHYPGFSPYFISLPFFSKKKFTVTVHDLTPLVFSKAYPPGIKGKIKFAIQKQLLLKAERIITDSENSKSDIIKFIGFPREKIDVIYLAPANKLKNITDKKILSVVAEKYHLPKKFVLYVGDVNYNKNLPGLVKACRMVGITCVVVGKQAVSDDFDKSNIENKPLIEFLELSKEGTDVLRLGFVGEEELSSLYSLASVYCQPSYYEGFGIQILEAMLCRCPVITSNVSSLPEAAGDAAVLVDPKDVSSISEAIDRVVKDKTFSDKMIRMGLNQVKKFSWEKTAEETIKTYEKILESK